MSEAATNPTAAAAGALLIAPSLITTLVIDCLQAPDVPHERVAELAGGTLALRWARPSLTMPADAPGQVRLGLAVEGGLALPNGRVLTVDAFVTMTAAPEIWSSATAWRVELHPRDPDPGEIRLSYGGERLTEESAAIPDLPAGADLIALRATLRERVIALASDLPAVPLSFTFAAPPEPPFAVSLVTDAHDTAALILTRALEPPTTPLVTAIQNVALAVPSADFVASFAAVMAELPAAALAGTGAVSWRAAVADQHLRVLAEVVDAAGTATTVALVVRPLLFGEQWDLLVDAVELPADLAADHPARSFAARPLTDDALRLRLAGWLRAAAGAALRELPGAAGAATWRWARATDGAGDLVEFSPSVFFVAGDWLVWRGGVPAEPRHTTPPQDAPSCALRVVAGPALSEDGARIQARLDLVFARGLTEPLDYAWHVSAGAGWLAAHEDHLDLDLPREPGDPSETPPRRTRSRPLPPGLALVTLAVIDAFGRVARADVELDVTPEALARGPLTIIKTSSLRYPPDKRPTTRRPLSALADSLESGTETPTWRWLALALGAVSLIILLVTWIALRSVPSAPSLVGRATATATFLPPTATLAITPIILTPPPTATIAPTVTPVYFARFTVTPLALVFACSGTTRGPMRITVRDSGNTSMTWSAHAVDAIGGVGWAALAPPSGTLQPRQVATVTVTPVDAYCAEPATTAYRVQFTASNAVPVTVTVTHT